MFRMPPIVKRCRMASPVMEQTDKNSVKEAVTNWEVALGVIMTSLSQDHWVGFNIMNNFKQQRYIMKAPVPSRF